MTALISLLLMSGGSIIALLGFRSFYAVCQPNQVLIFYGLRGRRDGDDKRMIGYRLLKGGSSLVVPWVEEVTAMDLGNMIIELHVNNALTSGGIRLTLEAVANVKVAGQEPAIHHAVERLLGKSRDEIKALAQVTLESNLRGVLAMLTPEQVNANRDVFARAMLAEAENDLQSLGLDLDSLQITAITDAVGYLDSIGRKQQVELLRQSRIAEAEARARARIEEAENAKITELVRITRDEAIATAEADRRIQDAVTRQTAMVAEAEADIAAELARAEAELPMQEQRIKQVVHQLQADVVAPAEAACQQAYAAARSAAASILENGAAQAEGLQCLAQSLQQAGPDARRLYLMQRLQPLMGSLRAAVPPIEVEQLRLIGDHASGSASLASMLAQVQAATGFDPTRWLRTGEASGGLEEKT
jgi:flotillin